MFKKKLGKIIKKVAQVGFRIVDNTVLGGAIMNSVEKTEIYDKKDGVVLHESKSGSLDMPKYISHLLSNFLLPLLLVIAIVKGWVSVETVKEVFSLVASRSPFIFFYH